MTLLIKKIGLTFMLLVLPCVVFSPLARAGDWTMGINISVPDPNADGGVLVNQLEAGSQSTATDLYDNASDVVALLAGPVQAAFSHEGETTYPAYLQQLWRDIRSNGSSESWTIKVTSLQNSSPVTMTWSAPPVIVSDSCHQGSISLLDQTTGQLIDLNTASPYSYASTGGAGSPDVRLFTLTVDNIPQDIPSVPTGLKSRSDRQNSNRSFNPRQRSVIQLQWTGSGDLNVAGYEVWRSTVSGGGYERLTSGPIVGTRYEDKQVVSGTTYYYVVTAVGTNGCESNYSQQTTVTAK